MRDQLAVELMSVSPSWLGDVARQVRHACAKLDSQTTENSAQLRYFEARAASLLDKSKLFHKIFASLPN